MLTITIAVVDPASAEKVEVALGDGRILELIQRFMNSPLGQALVALLLKRIGL